MECLEMSSGEGDCCSLVVYLPLLTLVNLFRLGENEVALKVSTDKVIRRILQHEASVYKVLEGLQGIHVPTLVGHGVSPSGAGYWLATAFIQGVNLRALKSSLSLSSSKWHLSSLKNELPSLAASALSAIHEKNVLHGDIRVSVGARN